MALVRSTEKALKGSKSSLGTRSELFFSTSFHAEGIALLVSSDLLRKRNLGQIDLARLRKDSEGWMIEIGEVKSSLMGVVNMKRGQELRILSAQRFLTGVFGHRGRILSLWRKN